MDEDAVEVFHYYGFHLSSSFLMYNFKFTISRGVYRRLIWINADPMKYGGEFVAYTLSTVAS